VSDPPLLDTDVPSLQSLVDSLQRRIKVLSLYVPFILPRLVAQKIRWK
jgi:hypothetical protein